MNKSIGAFWIFENKIFLEIQKLKARY